jgi:hypothetical protein
MPRSLGLPPLGGVGEAGLPLTILSEFPEVPLFTAGFLSRTLVFLAFVSAADCRDVIMDLLMQVCRLRWFPEEPRAGCTAGQDSSAERLGPWRCGGSLSHGKAKVLGRHLGVRILPIAVRLQDKRCVIARLLGNDPA